MTEPIYEFVKGEGWIVRSNHGTIITDKSGQMIRVINRKPSTGEMYVAITRGSIADGDGTFERHCAWLKTTTKYNNGRFPETYIYLDSYYYYTLEYL